MPPATGARQRVLFVGGMPRSGSTLLDLMVGQLPSHVDVGELFYMWQAGVLRNQLCACGEAFDHCPFWLAVGAEAFGGWEQLDIDDVLALQARVDTTARLPLARFPRLLSRHARDVARYLELTNRVIRATAAVSGADVVVDSTKRPSTAALLASSDLLDLRVAQVVRDPRGVVNSWSRTVALPTGAGANDHLKRRTTRQIVRRWVTVNVMIERLRRRGIPVHTVRYEDLVSDPRAAMIALLELWGRRPGPGDLDFLGPDGLQGGASHAIAGGRVRMRTGPIQLRLDEAWRRELPRWKRAVTVACTYPLMRRYGYL
jgi:hypothetical protein